MILFFLGIGITLIGIVSPMYYPVIEPYSAYILYLGIAFIVLALVLWFYRWRQKTITHKNRVKIRINRQNFYKSPYSIEFEAMNMSKKPCSFEEKIVFNSLIVAKRKETLLHGYKYKCEFHLKNTDRFIEPHEQKNFTAITNSANPQLLASQFRKYRFRFTNGTHTMVYIATPLSNAIPYWKYSVGKFLYRVFRRVKNPT